MNRLMSVVLWLVVCMPLWGCDHGPDACEKFCKDVQDEAPPDIFIDCSEEKWKSAETCAVCFFTMERDYDIDVTDPIGLCNKYFGMAWKPCAGITCSDHGTCIEGDKGVSASCECDDGYASKKLECIAEPKAEDFISGAQLDPCQANTPVCQTTAGCTLDETEYIEGSFPGFVNFVVTTQAGATIVVKIFFETQLHPGENTEIIWYEPGCNESHTYESMGANIFLLAGNDWVFEQEQQVQLEGPHLIDVYSDATTHYYLRVELR
jgi:hypothetical protein